MVEALKQQVKRRLNYRIVRRLYSAYILLRWRLYGKPSPPPHIIKQQAVKHFQKRYNLNLFIETGTYLGEMVNAILKDFSAIHSIELDKQLFNRAKELFSAHPHVTILHGDSSKLLPDLLNTISQRCLFWLDGHYSGGITAKGAVDYPILTELCHIQNHKIKDHVILIDDARLFTGENDTPSVGEICGHLKRINPVYTVEIRNDIIMAYVPEKN